MMEFKPVAKFGLPSEEGNYLVHIQGDYRVIAVKLIKTNTKGQRPRFIRLDGNDPIESEFIIDWVIAPYKI